jgi:hypothetical protein
LSTLVAKAYRHHPTCGILPSRRVRRLSDQTKRAEKKLLHPPGKRNRSRHREREREKAASLSSFLSHTFLLLSYLLDLYSNRKTMQKKIIP